MSGFKPLIDEEWDIVDADVTGEYVQLQQIDWNGRLNVVSMSRSQVLQLVSLLTGSPYGYSDAIYQSHRPHLHRPLQPVDAEREVNAG